MAEEFTRYERARIIGARALQIAMNAPLLIKLNEDELEKVKYDPLVIAEMELNSGILPISVKRPFPKKKQEKLRKARERKIDDREIDEIESEEEKQIIESGEIMELVNPEEDDEEAVAGKGDGEGD